MNKSLSVSVLPSISRYEEEEWPEDWSCWLSTHPITGTSCATTPENLSLLEMMNQCLSIWWNPLVGPGLINTIRSLINGSARVQPPMHYWLSNPPMHCCLADSPQMHHCLSQPLMHCWVDSKAYCWHGRRHNKVQLVVVFGVVRCEPIPILHREDILDSFQLVPQVTSDTLE